MLGFPTTHPSSRCVPCFQLYSCSKAHRPVLIAFLHAALCHVCFKVESLHTDAACVNSQLLCVLQLLLVPIQCWTSAAAFAVLHQHLSWDLELNCTILYISSYPQIHTHPRQHLPLASRLLRFSKGQIKLPGRKLSILAAVCHDSMLSSFWAYNSSFVITFTKTMLMFVLSMKCLHNSLLTAITLKILHPVGFLKPTELLRVCSGLH